MKEGSAFWEEDRDEQQKADMQLKGEGFWVETVF